MVAVRVRVRVLTVLLPKLVSAANHHFQNMSKSKMAFSSSTSGPGSLLNRRKLVGCRGQKVAGNISNVSAREQSNLLSELLRVLGLDIALKVRIICS